MNNIFLMAGECLSCDAVEMKIAMTRSAAKLIAAGQVDSTPHEALHYRPGRPQRPELVEPRDLPKRSLMTLEGRAAMIHSFAHIEFNAINLAWDIICRFQDMPLRFYQDWAKVADEEATHFNLLNQRLHELDYEYGDFPAHDGLWQMAEMTTNDILLRLAVVPRILEARGLDVTPDLIHRFNEVKDEKTAAVLNIIYKDEIGHVKKGSDWFNYVCHQRGLEPEKEFQHLFSKYAPRGNNKLNRQARMQAGFSETELDTILNK